MLSLHNLEKSKGTDKKSKRLGRGNATGSGNYSTRGMKGQRSRSGGRSGLALRSIRSYLLGIPKVRGFKSLNTARAIINIADLEKNFSDGDTVNIRAMLKAGLIETIANGVKVLSDGKLTKKITVEANAYSAGAKEKIETAGGQAMLVKKSESSKVEKSGDKK
ncbi:MAG: 50S ribosomal protein L15 [Patescibacteria group bacterium]|jgi:large subunit ribosomal protein L15